MQNNTIAAEEIQESIDAECAFKLPQLDELDLGNGKAPKFNFNKHINIEHLKCVVTAIAIAVGDNQDALDWIRYQYELTQSISKLISCKRYIGAEQSVYVSIKTLYNDEFIIFTMQTTDDNHIYEIFLNELNIFAPNLLHISYII